ncbi:MAG: flagellar hook-associated protein FlgK [Planctomycetales bacterium]|nr:flagellar hook-associated protein FlgK [Planctomycetales bacterium]
MMQLSIGVSALQASQRALEITGQNVSNASTPGYHRQTAQLMSAQPMQLGGFSIGRGVELSDVRRAVSDQVELALTRQVSDNGSVDARLQGLTRLESRLSSGDGSTGGQLESLFNQLEQLSSRLHDGASRKVVVSAASQLTHEVNSLATEMYRMRDDLDRSIAQVVGEINPLAKQIADLNTRIRQVTARGTAPNDLLDQRGTLINELGRRISVEVLNGNLGQVTLLASGVPLVIAERSLALEAHVDSAGVATVQVADSDAPLPITGGQLGGLLTVRNTRLGDYRSRLDALAREMSRAFDEFQSTGLGVSGAFTQLNGQRAVKDLAAPLNVSGLTFTPRSGSLFIGVTNTATGQRTLREVAIDPASQSLADVGTAISSVPNLQPFVNTQNGTLSLFAAPGYTFDFTGGLDTTPTTTFSAGTTSSPRIGGVFNGQTNDRYTFNFLTSGTVGVTSGLQVRVTNQAGDVVNTLDVGQGYSAGQPLQVANGVTVSLATGNVTAGDTFSTRVVGQPDTSGLLTALGLNTFFTGDDAATLKVNSDLLGNADRLATSRTGQPGDSSNLQRLVSLRDAARLNNGTLTMSQFYNEAVADVGMEVRNLKEQEATNQVLTGQLETEQQSISGVDPNEEMVQLLKYQKMFQIAAKYINTINEALDELIKII